jgi:integrase
MGRSSSGKSSDVSTSSVRSSSGSKQSSRSTRTKEQLPSCRNPICGKQFKPGHYGKRQQVGKDKAHAYVIACRTCKGSGEKQGETCWKCKGTKKVKQTCTEWYREFALQTKKPRRGIPADIFARIDKAAKADQLKHACLIAARESGIRKGELLGLTWSDILDANGKILSSFDIRGQWDDTRGFIPTKTKNSRTGFFLGDSIPVLSKLPQGEPNARVFPFYESQIYNWFISIQNRLHIKNPNTGHAYRWHDIRHSLGTELVHGHGEGGLALAKQVLGHKSLNTTMGYAQLSDNEIVAKAREIRAAEKRPV